MIQCISNFIQHKTKGLPTNELQEFQADLIKLEQKEEETICETEGFQSSGQPNPQIYNNKKHWKPWCRDYKRNPRETPQNSPQTK